MPRKPRPSAQRPARDVPIDVRAAAVADADILLAVLMRSYASNFEQLEPGALATPGYRDLLRERLLAQILDVNPHGRDLQFHVATEDLLIGTLTIWEECGHARPGF